MAKISVVDPAAAQAKKHRLQLDIALHELDKPHMRDLVSSAIFRKPDKAQVGKVLDKMSPKEMNEVLHAGIQLGKHNDASVRRLGREIIGKTLGSRIMSHAVDQGDESLTEVVQGKRELRIPDLAGKLGVEIPHAAAAAKLYNEHVAESNQVGYTPVDLSEHVSVTVDGKELHKKRDDVIDRLVENNDVLAKNSRSPRPGPPRPGSITQPAQKPAPPQPAQMSGPPQPVHRPPKPGPITQPVQRPPKPGPITQPIQPAAPPKQHKKPPKPGPITQPVQKPPKPGPITEPVQRPPKQAQPASSTRDWGESLHGPGYFESGSIKVYSDARKKPTNQDLELAAIYHHIHKARPIDVELTADFGVSESDLAKRGDNPSLNKDLVRDLGVVKASSRSPSDAGHGACFVKLPGVDQALAVVDRDGDGVIDRVDIMRAIDYHNDLAYNPLGKKPFDGFLDTMRRTKQKMFTSGAAESETVSFEKLETPDVKVNGKGHKFDKGWKTMVVRGVTDDWQTVEHRIPVLSKRGTPDQQDITAAYRMYDREFYMGNEGNAQVRNELSKQGIQFDRDRYKGDSPKFDASTGFKESVYSRRLGVCERDMIYFGEFDKQGIEHGFHTMDFDRDGKIGAQDMRLGLEYDLILCHQQNDQTRYQDDVKFLERLANKRG